MTNNKQSMFQVFNKLLTGDGASELRNIKYTYRSHYRPYRPMFR